MKLPAKKIADKVAKPLQVNLIVTIALAIITKSPLASEPWLAWLGDPAVIAAIVTLIGGWVGYQTEERSYQ